MSFLHGGADNIAPPSESSSLVNILRLAQQSCSYRRMMRIEEHNRHSVATLQDNNLAAFPIQHMPSPSEAVNFQYVYIPQARHADVIIEECLVANRSCCADYLCDYETVQSSNPDLGKRPARGVTTSEVVPDTVLQMAVPPSDRPLLLRFITLICPF
ncbi:hypothetical protein AGDE_15785 [Angomonas deanei]|uniref:Uncharacterized protein n=1 Tax=Angomonas deanei TaxID=59799 RepID=A0A7G2CPU3_9TRYP|nr:hypothetical protein AGDE_15785 [Angomonas deanei]CAD2221848.1 hypothetical protein, conserved [Angomonas deanei]|eukprot:EPY18474.1 hypothetical protein AGDE_15785 [Angomonas deanei]